MNIDKIIFLSSTTLNLGILTRHSKLPSILSVYSQNCLKYYFQMMSLVYLTSASIRWTITRNFIAVMIAPGAIRTAGNQSFAYLVSCLNLNWAKSKIHHYVILEMCVHVTCRYNFSLWLPFMTMCIMQLKIHVFASCATYALSHL